MKFFTITLALMLFKELSPQQPTVLQYRLVVHDGTIKPDTINALVTAP